MTGTSTRSRARAHCSGWPSGDAAGFPALYHRTVRLGRRRGGPVAVRRLTWTEQQVLRFLMPTATAVPTRCHVSATDDGEFAAVAAMILSRRAATTAPRCCSPAGRSTSSQPADDIWSGIAERASIVNAQRGLRPPETGNDNPAHYDDGAVARAVPVGIRLAGRA